MSVRCRFVGGRTTVPSRRWPVGRVRRVLAASLIVCLLAGTCTAGAAPLLPPPVTWPVSGPIVRGFDPPAEQWTAGHRGVDIAGAAGQPVLALASGTVVFAGLVAGKPVVVVSHGAVRSTYEPVAATVRVGQQVAAGAALGRLRAGHCASDACLHLGLKRESTYLDPTTELSGAQVAVRLLGEQRYRSARASARAAAATPMVARYAAAGPSRVGHFVVPADGPVTSRFGMRLHPVRHMWKLHDGVDFAAACGSPIRAALGGTVTYAGFESAWGWRLLIDHGRVNGHHLVTAYNHAQRYSVRAGSTVGAGQSVGRVGTTGLSTGCHLHLSAWVDGHLVDPLSLR